MADDLTNELIINSAELIETFKSKLINILQNERKLKADSKTLKSLKVVINENSKYVSLQAVTYIYYVINGRGPGRFPPPDPITNKWKIPFPVAKKIAEFGNKKEFKHVSDAFNNIYNELIIEVRQSAGKTALAYIKKIGTIHKVGLIN